MGMAQGLLTQEDGYLYGKDALMQPVLDAYSRTGRTPSPSDAARLGLLGYIAPVRSPYLDVDETSDDIRFEAAVPEFVKDAYGAVMSPMDVATGQISPEEGANRALNLIAVGGLMSPKPSGSLGIFGGRGSRTAPIGDFMIAERMAERGIHRDRIHKETGVYLDPIDRQMKYEISDDQAKLTKFAQEEAGSQPEPSALESTMALLDFAPKPRNYYKLKDILDDKEFYKAYPELADTPVSVKIDRFDRGGALSKDREGQWVIRASGVDEDEIRSVLLHEMQHLVQQKEKGFGQGGNPDAAFDIAKRGLDKEIGRATARDIDEFDAARREAGVLARAELILKNQDITPKPRLLFGQGDWYKYGTSIVSELGPMPKRSGPKQKEWLRQAGRLMASKQLNDDDYYQKYEIEGALQKYNYDLAEIKKAVRRADYKADKLRTADTLASMKARDAKSRLEGEMYEKQGADQIGPFNYDLYRRLAGEVEARNVQQRRDMTKEERRNMSPRSTQDVTPDQTLMTTNPAAGLLYQQNPYREDIFGRYQGGLL
jgi:hypothetical protein